MEKKYFAKEVLAPTAPETLDDELKAACVKAYESYITLMDDFHLAEALASVFEMFSRANKYIDETTPWVLAKDESKRERLGTVLYNLLETIRWGAVMLAPFIPETSAEIFAELGTGAIELDTIGTHEKFCGIEAGKSVGDSKVLFARVDEEKKLQELEEKAYSINTDHLDFGVVIIRGLNELNIRKNTNLKY
jgi:methionyl-tRNA synthetase